MDGRSAGGLLYQLAYLGWGICGLPGECFSRVRVGEGVGVLDLRSLLGILSFEGSRAGDVLVMGSDPVSVLRAGGFVVLLWS